MAVQAGACFFGIVGVAALVVIVTTIVIVRRSKQKKIAYESVNSVRHNGFDYHYDPETKTIVESGAPVSNSPNNNLRKRSPSVVSAADKKSEKSSNTKGNSKVSQEVQTDPTDINQNIDHSKILPDKVLMPMSSEEKVINYLSGDIPASISESIGNGDPVNNLETLSNASSSNWSNLSSEKSADNSVKAYKKKVHKSMQKYVTDMIQKTCELHAATSDENSVCDTGSDNLSTSSSWSNISTIKSTDDFEKAYKKTMRKTLKELVKDMGKTSRVPSECSDESEFSVISREPEKCYTCKENPVNIIMQPCMHRYLCSDCAPKIFRVQKKCKVCRAKIERVAVEE